MRVKSPRVVVVKSSAALYLFDGTTLVRKYPIRSGSEQPIVQLEHNNRRTPVGRFQIVAKKSNSPYFRFLGLDYPDIATMLYGVHYGFISPGEARAIERAHDGRACPSWLTALGGAIGLHGGGEQLVTTAGCIALADEHIAEVFDVLRIGDPVEILP
ncbi:MAG: L,D-transpeptidase [Phycisphaerales bacterium]|nr:L,D-transpeptidase [Phycisphaerales bacterium]